MMFCPKCGQPSSDEIRFCPKCGLSLAPHAALLASGHAAAAVHGAPQPPARTRKQINTRRAGNLMFFSIALIPIFIGLGIAADGAEPLLLPFFAFLTGLAWLVYARLFSDDLVPVSQGSSRRDLGADAERQALNAPLFVPASSFNQQRADTAEMARPPGVTEHSTRLLDKDV
jgi:ribosomal protein S27AE